MKLPTLLALVGALPFPAKSAPLPDWRKPFAALFLALHESRRRQAEREVGRHRHLLNHHARPLTQAQSAADAGDTASR